MRRLLALWRASYGDTPLHLLSQLATVALAGYAALQASHGPLPKRMAVWFLVAAIAHDLVLFPLYSLINRLVAGRRSRRAVSGAVNYVRVPVMLSGLLLLVTYPLVLRRSEDSYGRASGLNQAPYLGRWLLITAALCTGSALLFAVRSVRHRDGKRSSEARS
jgi:hypothetical protein